MSPSASSSNSFTVSAAASRSSISRYILARSYFASSGASEPTDSEVIAVLYAPFWIFSSGSEMFQSTVSVSLSFRKSCKSFSAGVLESNTSEIFSGAASSMAGVAKGCSRADKSSAAVLKLAASSTFSLIAFLVSPVFRKSFNSSCVGASATGSSKTVSDEDAFRKPDSPDRACMSDAGFSASVFSETRVLLGNRLL